MIHTELSVHEPPAGAAWVALLAALAGAAAAGLVGAVALTPLVGVVRVIVDEIRRDDFPGATVQVSPLDQRRVQ